MHPAIVFTVRGAGMCTGCSSDYILTCDPVVCISVALLVVVCITASALAPCCMPAAECLPQLSTELR